MRYWDGETILMWFFGSLVCLVIVAIVVAAACGAIDFAQERRSFDARMACETRQLRAERKPLSSRVVCLPDRARRDTTTLEVKQ